MSPISPFLNCAAELYFLGVLGGSIMASGFTECPIPASTRSFTAIRATGGDHSVGPPHA